MIRKPRMRPKETSHSPSPTPAFALIGNARLRAIEDAIFNNSLSPVGALADRITCRPVFKTRDEVMGNLDRGDSLEALPGAPRGSGYTQDRAVLKTGA